MKPSGNSVHDLARKHIAIRRVGPSIAVFSCRKCDAFGSITANEALMAVECVDPAPGRQQRWRALRHTIVNCRLIDLPVARRPHSKP
jgi:hypothetical protein